VAVRPVAPILRQDGFDGDVEMNAFHGRWNGRPAPPVVKKPARVKGQSARGVFATAFQGTERCAAPGTSAADGSASRPYRHRRSLEKPYSFAPLLLRQTIEPLLPPSGVRGGA